MTGSETDMVMVAKNLKRTYTQGPVEIQALNGVDLSAAAGSVVVIKGRSGSGKTTLLNLIGGLDDPTEGSVWIDGQMVFDLGDNARSQLRQHKVGYIFQSFGLIPVLSAQENVEIPLRMVGADSATRQNTATELLDLVGLGDRAKHRPGELSGGEQQRVAVARALANRPRLLLADEPTGQLDSKTGQEVVRLLSTLVRSGGITAIIATHDTALMEVADQVLELDDGYLTPLVS